jgi:hypothetical protein
MYKYVKMPHVQTYRKMPHVQKYRKMPHVQKYRKMPLCTKISQNATMYKSMAKCHNVCTKYNKTSHVQNITKSHMNKIITK